MKNIMSLNSIKLKIIFSIIISCSLLSIVIGIYVIFQSSNFLEYEIRQKLLLIGENYQYKYDGVLLNAEKSVNYLATTLVSNFDINEYKLDSNYLEKYKEINDNIIKEVAKNSNGSMGAYFVLDPNVFGKQQGIWYADLKGNGEFIKQTITDILRYDKNDKEHVGWYYEPIKEGKGIWMKPYFNKNINMQIISYEVPIFKDNKIIGIIGMDIKFDNLFGSIRDIKLYKTGYGSLLDHEYNFLIHPNLTQVDNLKNINKEEYNAITDVIKEKNVGFIESGNKYSIYSKLNNGYILYMPIDKSECFSNISKTKVNIILLSFIMTILSIIIALIVGNKIIKPIYRLTKLVDKTSKLDLSYDKDDKTLLCSKDETGKMAKATLNTREKLREIIGFIKEKSNNVANSSKHLIKHLDNNSTSLKQIAQAVEELANGSSNQSYNAQEGCAKLNELSKEIESLTKDSNEISNYINNIIDLNKNGKQQIEKIYMITKENNELSKSAVEQVDKLENKSKNISVILETINKISEQINLLSLNAMIEAARAGDSGKGFAVVAEEIRNLSDETKKSIKDIEDTIKSIQNEVKSTKKISEYTNEIVEKTNETSMETGLVINLIAKEIDKVAAKIINIIDSINTININKGKVLTVIQETSAISQQSASSAQEISASTQEQLNSMEKIYEFTKEFEELILELDGLINQFKL